MSFKWDRVQVWSVEVSDEPGAAAGKLAFLAQAGANLEYVEMQRLPEKPGHGIVYVAPVTGPSQVRAAKSAGFGEASNPVVRRIEGDNEAGLAHRLTQQWSLAGINLHGLTMTAVGHTFVGFAAFDSVADANRAAQILADLGTAGT